MLLKIIVLLMMLAILISLGSAAVSLLRNRDQAHGTKMVRALTWRIGLSLTLFILLMAGFYFGVISPHGAVKP